MAEQYQDDTNQNVTKVKFRSGYGLQSRELNALQTHIKRQISSIGDHLFKDGSPVVGGSIKFDQGKSLLVNSQYLGSDIDLQSFVGQVIEELDSSGSPTGARGKVFAVSEETSEDSAAIHYIDESVDKIEGVGSVRTLDSSIIASVKSSETPVRDCLYVRVLEGVFYFQKNFVFVENQLHVYSKFTTEFSGFVGIEFEEQNITEFDDTTLYDPSRGNLNYNAPGAHREVFIGTLTHKNNREDLTSNFITLSELKEGNIKTVVDNPQLNIIGDIMARRTYDESGDYVKSQFNGTILDKVNIPVRTISPSTTSSLEAHVETAYENRYNEGDTVVIPAPSTYAGSYVVKSVLSSTTFTIDLPTPNTLTENNQTVYRSNHYGIAVSAGKAYVKGYEVSLPSGQDVEIKKAVDTEKFENNLISADYGQYVIVNTLQGVIDFVNHDVVDLLNSGATKIGEAKARAIKYHSTGKYRIYLIDVQMNTGQNVSDVTSMFQASASALGTTDFSADIDGTFELIGVNTRPTVFPIDEYMLKTVKPDNADTLSFVAQEYFQLASSSGSVTFNANIGQTFVGARSTNIASLDSFKDNYVFIDSTSGSVIDPTSAIISGAGTSITVDVGVDSQISMIASLNTQLPVKTKSVVNATTNITAGTITAINRTADLGHADIKSVTILEGSDDITNRFIVDNGQRDTYYGIGRITLKSGVIVPSGDLTVNYEYYQHSGSSYFTVDSYPDDDIPNYTFETDGRTINLRNAIDFRPVKTTGGAIGSNSTPAPSGTISLDFDYYMSRKDLIVFNSNGTLTVVYGIPSLDPEYPEPDENQMILFRVETNQLTQNPYVDVNLITDQNPRYTMKDIGVLDKRIDRLEYETSLSLLEAATKQTDVVDGNGLNRFKTGFLVDNFTDHSLGQTSHPDYRVAIDRENNLIRPMYTDDAIGFKPTNIDNFTVVGNDSLGYFVTLPHTTTEFVANDIASKALSVNPYLVTKRVGSLNISPSSDYWADRTQRPVRNIEFNTQEISAPPDLRPIWNEWQTAWSGQITRREIPINRNQIQTTTTVSPITQTQSIGSHLVDVSVSEFMRAITLTFNASGMRPNTDLHVFVDRERVDDLVTSTSTPVGQGSCRTDVNGNVSGTIEIPAGRFRTGERLITLTDEANNISDDATTESSFIFAANGLITESSETVITTRTRITEVQQNLPPDIINNVTTIRPDRETAFQRKVRKRREERRRERRRRDPLAQTFWISEEAFPNGLFLSDLDLFFKRKPDSTDPIIVQIRPTVNGYPHSTDVVPLSEKVISNANVKIPDRTDDLESVQSSPTNVKFDVPIYLSPNNEYCIVVLSDNAEYELYVSELGKNIIGTETVIYKQPVLGSLFRSQNASTWTAYQNEDLMFNLNIAQFDTSIVGSFEMINVPSAIEKRFNLINVQPQLIKPADTILNYSLSTMDATTVSTVDNSLNPRTNVELSSERIIRENQSDVKITITGLTSDVNTAPLFDLDRFYAITVHNQINNFGLVDEGFSITNQGSGYSSNPTITITGGGGSGASVEAIVDSGSIIGFNIINPGQGYTSPPTITITDSIGNNAEAVYSGFEEDASGGNALARYITHPITLQDGFEADYCQIYADTYIPAGTDIRFYVRSVSSSDQNLITSTPWTEVNPIVKKQSTKNEFYETRLDVDLQYTDANGVSHDTVKTIQAKVVLLSNNSSVVPKAKAFRLITAI